MEEKKYEDEKKEAQKRFDALPETLKKEIQADKNAELIHVVCKDYSIPEEKVKYVTMLVGEVFLGYIKPEMIAHELNTYFDIDLQKSNFIEIELKQKLFNGLKTDLDKIYNPLPAEAPAKEGAVNEEVPPTIINFESDKTTQSLRVPPKQSSNEIATLRPSEVFDEGGSQTPAYRQAGLANDKKISPLTMGAMPFNQDPSVIPGLPLNGIERASSQKGGTRNPESQNLDSRLHGNDKKTIEPSILAAESAPFIIQTKTEAVKAAIPQFPKESPSLNLRVDPSIIQKSTIAKPISVYLETAQPVQEKRFQMPVIAGQKIFSSAPQPTPTIPQATQPKIEMKPNGILTSSTSEDLKFRDLISVSSEVKRPETHNRQRTTQEPQKLEIKPKEATPLSQPLVKAPSLKEISEQKTVSPLITPKPTLPEPPKVVHYSNFKTDLTQFGAPIPRQSSQPSQGFGGQAGQGKTEPARSTGSGQEKDGFINLNTFTKVRGNTIDLRKSSS